MIKSLTIQNFQSHKNTTLEFDKGVNVITGSSDSGKTSIVRALRWLVWNRPGGDSFRSYWGGDTIVTVITDNATDISRSKGASGNLYKAGENSFVGFSTNVPQEVQDLLKMDEINLQQQLDSPFLLSETPGNVAQYFNKIANLDKIDSTTSNINSAIRKINADIQYTNEQINKYEQKLNEFPDLEAIEKQLNRIERKEVRCDDLYENIQKMKRVIANINSLDNEIEIESDLLQYEKTINLLLTKLNNKKSLNQSITDFKNVIHRIKQIDLDTIQLHQLIKIEDTVNTLIVKCDGRDKQGTAVRKLKGQLYKLSTLDQTLLKTQQNATKLEDDFHNIFPDTCPLCGTPKIKIKT
jgi:exonuclease SbcC